MSRLIILSSIGAFFVALIAFAVWDEFNVRTSEMYVFEGLSGPAEPSVVETPAPTPWRRFAGGDPSRLAVLLTDPSSEWLGLAHALKTAGIPFTITDDHVEAVRHRVVLVYPRISGSVLETPALRALADLPRRGATLIGVNVLGGGLESVFGFEGVEASRDHERIRIDPGHPLAQGPGGALDPEIRIARTSLAHTGFGTRAYLDPTDRPLATFEDGSAAITARALGEGRAYAFGFDIGHLFQRSFTRRTEGVADRYANTFEPSLDVLMRLLENIYRSGEPDAVTIGTVPDGQALAVMMTHDIDYSRSMANAVTYARHERENGFAGTHFLQTKYVRDWNDEIFFNESNRPHLEALKALGMELASHSVSHSKVFHGFELGDGTERYPDYRPFVKNANRAYGANVLGELRVSRFLIESLAPGARVESFRPGHLSYPGTLPQALEAAGYRYSSSVTANVSLTHLPFRLNHDRGSEAETGIFEFPITIEDELDAPMLARLDAALTVARNIARYGGICVVLIHPDVLGQKFEFQQRFVAALQGEAWFGSIGEFGAWWSARDAVELDVRRAAGGLVIEMSAKRPVAGLVLELPHAWVPAPGGAARARRVDEHWVFDVPAGRSRIALIPAS